MPKLVDHGERRRQVAMVAFETMRDVGPERATIREISRRGGFSHSLLGHYFRDSEEVYGFAYRYLTESALGRVEQRTAHLRPGVQRLYAALDESCPYRLGVGAVATLSFWVHAVGNKRNRAVQKRTYALWRGCLRRYMDEALQLRHIAPGMSTADLLDATVMFLDGLCVGAVLEPRRWTRAGQIRLVNVFFESLFRPKRKYSPGA
jgi:AcrR family transcriptional regulator